MFLQTLKQRGTSSFGDCLSIRHNCLNKTCFFLRRRWINRVRQVMEAVFLMITESHLAGGLLEPDVGNSVTAFKRGFNLKRITDIFPAADLV